MSRKRALIVDDSKVAQVKLRKLLARYDVDVDIVGSAEEALSYLTYKRPAVIFMDHLMEGMDGFEAVKIIKANPDTAMVPIIMYTSKSGDMYVGQARALGALDVISKETIEPSNLDKVLEGVKIFLRSPDSPAQPPTEPDPPPHPNAPQHEQTPVDALRGQIARMLEINLTKVRLEIGDSNRLLMNRLSREIQDIKARVSALQRHSTPTATKKPRPEPEPDPIDPLSLQKTTHNRQWIFYLLIIAALLLIFFQLYQYNQHQDALNKSYAILSQTTKEQHQQLVTERQQSQLKNYVGQDNADGNRIQVQALYNALAWSINKNNYVAFGELALDKKQLSIVSALLHYLHTAHFSGEVLVKMYFGNFCVTFDKSGKFILPKENSSTSDCQLMSSYGANYSPKGQQSWAFRNFLLNSPILQEGNIQIKIESHGLGNPNYPYPPLSSVSTAGEWNKIAQSNNRVEISLIPAPS